MGVREVRRGVTIAGALVGVVGLVAAASGNYVVRPGDTLSGIAAKHGVTVQQLAEANGIKDPDRIFAGQTLTLPGSAGRNASGGARVHRVRPGEHLTGIAARYGVRVSGIVRANRLSDPNHVVVGQRLRIPGGGGGGGVSAAGGGKTTRPAPSGSVSRAEAGRVIERVARQHGWNPAFVKALAWQESGWQMSRISRTGAVGIMQVQPGTGRFVSQHLAGRPLNLSDPVDNVTAGVLFLDYLWDLTDGDVRMTLGGYYQGLASIRRNGMYDDTKRYIANVLALKQRFS